MKKRFKKNFVSLKLVCLATGVLFSLKFLKNLDHSDYVEKIQDKIEDEIDELFLEEKYQDYFNYFKNVKLNYNREDLYSTKEELLTIINYQKYSSCQYNFDEDIKKLVSIIVENTEDYLSSHHEFRNPFDRQFLDEALLDVDFLMLLERTLDELFINAENDFAEDVCRMQDLKIVLGSIESKKDTITMASFLRRENVIIVSDEAILKVLSNAGVINDSVIEKEMIHVLKHELNHVRQLDCLCIRNSKNIINNLRYDELYVPFYVESSAESAIYNEGQWNKDAVFLNELSIEYTYYTERKFESLLQLLSIFDESVGLNDYYEAIFSGDFFKMYQFLGLTDEDEIYDFYKIVYSMDAILGRNKFSYECYNKNEVSFEEKKEAVGYAYKLELYNLFLSRMVDYTRNHVDYTILENYQMLSIIDLLIIDEVDFSSLTELGHENLQYFVDNFNLSRNKYLEFLEEHYHLSRDEFAGSVFPSFFSLYRFFHGEDFFLYDRFSDLRSILWSCEHDLFLLREEFFSFDNEFGDFSLKDGGSLVKLKKK